MTDGWTPLVADLVSNERWSLDPQVACFLEEAIGKFKPPNWYDYALYDRVFVLVDHQPKPTKKDPDPKGVLRYVPGIVVEVLEPDFFSARPFRINVGYQSVVSSWSHMAVHSGFTRRHRGHTLRVRFGYRRRSTRIMRKQYEEAVAACSADAPSK